MPWWNRRRLASPSRWPGGAALRPGQRGEAVKGLQQRLQELGYDPGPVDGVYGYQTAEAVRDLQRDYRLRVDGVAGPRVMAVLADPDLLGLRRSHLVAPGQTLGDAARALDVPLPLLRRALGPSHRDPLLPGRRLVVWERFVAVAVEPDDPAAFRALGRWAGLVSAVSIPAGGAPPEDDAAAAAVARARGLDLPIWITVPARRAAASSAGGDDPGQLQRLLHRPRDRKQLVQRAAAWLDTPGVAGLHLDLGALRFGDGPRALSMLRELAGLAGNADRQLVVSVPVRSPRGLWSKLFDDVDWEAVARLAAPVILVPPVLMPGTRPPRPPSPAELAGPLRAITRRIPPWRCLLALSVGALAVPLDHGPSRDTPGTVAYQKALSMAYGAGTRPRWDEASQRPLFRCTQEGRECLVWLENRDSLARKLDLVEALRLGGVYLTDLGREDGRFWPVLQSRWKVHKPAAG